MADVVALVVFVGCILAFFVLLFWYGLRGEPNQDPAIGTNRPYPEGVGPTGAGADVPPYLPTFTVSEAETFRRGADRRLTRLFRRPPKARSWMDEPGALEAAGLVDAPPSTEPGVVPAMPPRRHRRKQHR
ncbi:MAG: hypothetical protein ACYDCS_14900 [Candidatus Dormibacteria bacterium]